METRVSDKYGPGLQWATMIVLFFAAVSCQQESSNVEHGKEQVTNVSSDETLSSHIGDRVRVTGRARRLKAGSFVNSDIESFELLEWEWSERTVGDVVVVTGVLGRVEEYVAPKFDGPVQTNEPPGALIPARYTLTDVRFEGVQMMNMSSDDNLSSHIGDRVRVTGRAGRTRAGSFVSTDIKGLYFDLLEWDWPERTVGAEVVVTGVLGKIEAHVAPKQDPEFHFATDEPPGALIPASYTLTDVRLVETHER